MLITQIIKKIKRKLPKGPLIVSYVTIGCSFKKIVREVTAGVNVLVWFQSNLSKEESTALVRKYLPIFVFLVLITL